MRRKKLRVLSAIVAALFLVQDFSFAAMEMKASEITLFPKSIPSIELPKSVATVGESYQADSRYSDSRFRGNDRVSRNDKTFILVQDAHTNESAQMNIARSLKTIIQKEKIRFVFLEAADGNNSLALVRDKAPEKKRELVAREYLRKGILDGSEYLDITADPSLDFIPWGVEDKELYWKSLKAYEKVAKGREKFKAYLDEVARAIETLKPRIFGPSLQELDAKRQEFLKEKMALTDYIEVLMNQMKFRNSAVTHYPHLMTLSKLKDKEKAIDFEKANQEQNDVVASLSEEDRAVLSEAAADSKDAPFKFSAQDNKIQKAFYALLEEKIGVRSSEFGDKYPELAKYFVYLKEAEKISPKDIIEEQKLLEEEIYVSLAKTEDERSLHQADEAQRFLQKLFNLTVTPDEFRAYKKDKESYDIKNVTGFLNRKIMDLQDFYERVTFLKDDYEEYIGHAEAFYRLTYERDMAFLENSIAMMDKVGDTKAILVTGGYHTPNLMNLLRDKSLSYIVITPQVLHETNIKKYESLLLGQTEKDIDISPKKYKDGGRRAEVGGRRSEDSERSAENGEQKAADKIAIFRQLAHQLPVLALLGSLTAADVRQFRDSVDRGFHVSSDVALATASVPSTTLRLSSARKGVSSGFRPTFDKLISMARNSLAAGKQSSSDGARLAGSAAPVLLTGRFRQGLTLAHLIGAPKITSSITPAELNRLLVDRGINNKARFEFVPGDTGRIIAVTSQISWANQELSWDTANANDLRKLSVFLRDVTRPSGVARQYTRTARVIEGNFSQAPGARLAAASPQDISYVVNQLKVYEGNIVEVLRRYSSDNLQQLAIQIRDDQAQKARALVLPFAEYLKKTPVDRDEAVKLVESADSELRSTDLPFITKRRLSDSLGRISNRLHRISNSELQAPILQGARLANERELPVGYQLVHAGRGTKGSVEHKVALTLLDAAHALKNPLLVANPWRSILTYATIIWRNTELKVTFATKPVATLYSPQRSLEFTSTNILEQGGLAGVKTAPNEPTKVLLTISGPLAWNLSLPYARYTGDKFYAIDSHANVWEVALDGSEILIHQGMGARLSDVPQRLESIAMKVKVLKDLAVDAPEAIAGELEDMAKNIRRENFHPAETIQSLRHFNGRLNARGATPAAIDLAGEINEVSTILSEISTLSIGARLAMPTEIEKGRKYWAGESKTKPTPAGYKPAANNDVKMISRDFYEDELKVLEVVGAQSVNQGEGTFISLIAGASTRMNPADVPDDVHRLAGGDITSKAAVPIGEWNGKPVTYLGEDHSNLARMLSQIESEAQKAGIESRAWQNEALHMTNAAYETEHRAMLEENQNYGLNPGQVKFFNQPLGPVYYARPEAASAAKYDNPDQKPKAIVLSERAKVAYETGDLEALIIPDERQAQGHGEMFHQIVANGKLLQMIDAGRKWGFVRNIDNVAAKYDKTFLRALGYFLSNKLDFLIEGAPNFPGHKGGKLYTSPTNNIKMDEDPNAVAAGLNPQESAYVNNAVGFFTIKYVINLYKKPGQSDEDFIKEYRTADESGREVIAQRGRERFPLIWDAKASLTTDAAYAKGETNMWQSLMVVDDTEVRTGGIGVDGAMNFDIDAFLVADQATQDKMLSTLRFIATKNWNKPGDDIQKARAAMEKSLGRPISDNQLAIALETYVGNRILYPHFIKYSRTAQLVTPGIFSKSFAGARLATPASKGFKSAAVVAALTGTFLAGPTPSSSAPMVGQHEIRTGQALEFGAGSESITAQAGLVDMGESAKSFLATPTAKDAAAKESRFALAFGRIASVFQLAIRNGAVALLLLSSANAQPVDTGILAVPRVDQVQNVLRGTAEQPSISSAADIVTTLKMSAQSEPVADSKTPIAIGVSVASFAKLNENELPAQAALMGVGARLAQSRNKMLSFFLIGLMALSASQADILQKAASEAGFMPNANGFKGIVVYTIDPSNPDRIQAANALYSPVDGVEGDALTDWAGAFINAGNIGAAYQSALDPKTGELDLGKVSAADYPELVNARRSHTSDPSQAKDASELEAVVEGRASPTILARWAYQLPLARAMVNILVQGARLVQKATGMSA